MRFRVMALADAPLRVGSCRVEIAQRGEAQSIGVIERFEDALHEIFAFAVGIDRVLRMFFVHRHVLRIAVGGARGGKDEILHVVAPHGIQNGQRGDSVVVDSTWTAL